ncbi:MAG TPA: hypothetical protein VIG64_15295 [Actinomycetota bacterium]
MIERAFRLTTRIYWSVFFLVATLTVPLHVLYATIFRNVIAVSDLHADIEAFPPLRQVHGVGREQLGHARLAYWILWAIEIAALPLLVRAARRISDVDAKGGVPSAADGWGHLVSAGAKGILRAFRRPGPLLVGLAIAAAVYALTRTIGGLLVEPLSDDRAFAGVGLVEGVARAAAAPFFLVVAVVVARERT